jgi:hypothetical protein
VTVISLEAYVKLIDLPVDLQRSLQVSSSSRPSERPTGYADKSQHLLPEQCYHALHRIRVSLRHPNVRMSLISAGSWQEQELIYNPQGLQLRGKHDMGYNK